MITVPPKNQVENILKTIAEKSQDKLQEYLYLLSPIDNKERYLHFHEFQYRVPHSLDLEIAWSVLKLARASQLKSLIKLGEPPQTGKFFLTPTIQKAISETDRNTTTASLEWMCNQIGEKKHFDYLLHDLIDDEAISSSQLEGAATTTKVAKNLLKRKRQPRTPDEKMIVGNFKMMNSAWENRHQDLSLDLLREFHQIGVECIDDQLYQPGVFRKTDDVFVVDSYGDTIHAPPPAQGLSKRLKNLVEWTNLDHHQAESPDYLHPLVKAITLHFAIGYEHPFHDGNGRVARSLFYWYLFKNGFAAFRYIAISVLLKKAPVKYSNSYLYTETDDLDLTYFIDYQCSMIIKAINQFNSSYQQAFKDIQEFDSWLWESGLYRKLTEKQKIIFQVAKNNTADSFTANEVKDNLGCSYNTASNTLNGLVKLQLFKKEKPGREWVFSMLSKDKILANWKAK